MRYLIVSMRILSLLAIMLLLLPTHVYAENETYFYQDFDNMISDSLLSGNLGNIMTTELDVSDYVLQAGTMDTRKVLVKSHTPGARWFASAANTQETIKVIVDGLKNYAPSINISEYNIYFRNV